MSFSALLKGQARSIEALNRRIEVARGERAADLVIRNVAWLDVFSGLWQTSDIAIHDQIICGVGETYQGRDTIDGTGKFLVPGFIDAHVHIESSMMTPERFEEAVLPRGTTTAIWDPHEIANVKGVAGIDWALESTEGLDLDVFVMVPSCVPSTSPAMNLESSGAVLAPKDLEKFRSHPRVLGLAEMMNWPGLLGRDPEVMQKLLDFSGLRRDGHCPNLSGKDLNAYAVAGIHSCHESTTLVEAQEKLSKGVHVLIREGSCAKDADALLPSVNARSAMALGFCSDDRNPLDIEESGHIDCIVNKGLRLGMNPLDLFRSASYSTALMYGLQDRGAIAPGYLADVVLVSTNKKDDWNSGIQIDCVLKKGRKSLEDERRCNNVNHHQKFFGLAPNLNTGFTILTKSHLALTPNPVEGAVVTGAVIGIRPNQIITDRLEREFSVDNGLVNSDVSRDILKIAVIERHHGLTRIGLALAEGFGLKRGAIATSINHDCHNIIVTGSSDEAMLAAYRELIKIDGGIVVISDDGKVDSLSLPVGGLMTTEPPSAVSIKLKSLKRLAKDIGCELDEPFLQLSFLALPVIPNLKITDRGLVDANSFQVIPIFQRRRE